VLVEKNYLPFGVLNVETQSAIAILQHTGTFKIYDLQTRTDYKSIAIRRQHQRNHNNESVRSQLHLRGEP
jgi:hypothetical protein